MTHYPVPRWNFYALGRYHYFGSQAEADACYTEYGGEGPIRRTTVYYTKGSAPTVTGNEIPCVSGNAL